MFGDWDKFLLEGDVLFKYMVRDFKSMINSQVIKDFEIEDSINRVSIDDIDVHSEVYKNDIHSLLLPWIQAEYKSGRLFEKGLWRPVRDWQCLSFHGLGYRILFQYKNYYFQLCIVSYEFIEQYELDNKGINENNSVYFSLAFIGWKNEGSDKLQPGNRHCIPPDNVMPDVFWNREYNIS
jgi:hypothetical protein